MGTTPEFHPVEDIHIGVISSSLGGHGSGACPRQEAGSFNDDQAHLIGSARGLSEEFLSWNGGDASALDDFVADLGAHVTSAGETGCRLEAPLEAWYRFLVDPQPPQELVLDSNARAMMTTDANGVPIVDDVVLAQRAAFLRPDSLVAIVVLTDENDCSAMDGGSYYSNASFGYLVAEATFDMPMATSACESNPNDPCCFSCLQAENPPSGCEPYAVECSSGGTVLAPERDRPSVRCFQNKRRFGVDLLYPTERYVDALTKSTIIDARNGSTVDNPLLRAADGTQRNPELVLFAGIVGVPWQDIGTPESLEDPNVMEYLTAAELSARDVPVVRNGTGTLASRWEVMVGTPGLAASTKVCQNSPTTAGCGVVPILPDDPFMIESIDARTPGLANPISGDVIVAATSTSPTANDINGHEVNHAVVDILKYDDGGPANDDLQYACIFSLLTPKTSCTASDAICACGDEPLRNRPVCQPPAGGAATTTQYFGEAYPGTRILEVLRDVGENSVVASLCPKIVTGDAQNPNFGYNPAMRAILDRMREELAGSEWAR